MKKQLDLRQIRALGRIQCSLKEVALVMGVSEAEIKSDADAYAAYECAKDGFGKVSLRRKQWKLAETNAQMAIKLGETYIEEQKPKDTQIGVVPVFVNDYGKEDRD